VYIILDGSDTRGHDAANSKACIAITRRGLRRAMKAQDQKQNGAEQTEGCQTRG
jgi:hypothetical protein